MPVTEQVQDAIKGGFNFLCRQMMGGNLLEVPFDPFELPHARLARLTVSEYLVLPALSSSWRVRIGQFRASRKNDHA